jgi:hypothetical protein
MYVEIDKFFSEFMVFETVYVTSRRRGEGGLGQKYS